MIILEWLALSLIFSGLFLVCLDALCLPSLCKKLCLKSWKNSWHNKLWARYWVMYLIPIFAALLYWQKNNFYMGYLVGLFVPCGLMLPAIIAGYFYNRTNSKVPFSHFKVTDVIVLSSLQLLLMLSSWSLVPWDIYRLGYTPWATAIAGGLIIYAYIRNLPIIAIVAGASFILWITDIGSSNYFNLTSHALLLIIALVWLFKQMCVNLFERIRGFK